MYADFYGDKDVERRYAEGVFSMSMKEFQTDFVPIGNKVR